MLTALVAFPSSRCTCRRRRAFALLVTLLGLGDSLTAQPATSAGAPPTMRVLEGRVLRPVLDGGDSTGMLAVPRQWVVLHRLGKDSAGAIDSVRSDGAGNYRFAWRPFGAPEAIYFASTTYGGIAYFTPPAKSDAVRGDDARLTVFDTTSRPFPLSVKGRHLIVGQRDTGNVRTIIEVFELSNDSLRTLVSADLKTPTWRVRIPGAATGVRVNTEEISPKAFRADSGAVEIFSPIAPGVMQLSFTYTVPENAFPLAFTAHDGAVVFEILLEDMAAAVQALGFTRVGEVTLEGRRFQRFLSQDVKPDTRLAIDVPGASAPALRLLQRYGMYLAAGFFALLFVGRRLQRRASARAGAPVPTLRTTMADDDASPERLREALRQLDATWARQTAPSDHLQRTYTARRAELEAALAAAQALAQSGTAP